VARFSGELRFWRGIDRRTEAAPGVDAEKRSFDALPSRQFRGRRSAESDSHKTSEFPARKSCVKKRMRIRDEPSGGSNQTVVWRHSRKTIELPILVVGSQAVDSVAISVPDCAGCRVANESARR
jgi:hypothetical protein